MTIKKRLKLWEIPADLHCSIIGTCLSIKEVLKLMQKTDQITIDKKNEYLIHTTAVSLSIKENSFSKAMDKYLNKKFSSIILKYSRLKNDDELKNQADKDMKNNNITGIYWTVMTHPYSTIPLTEYFFGKIHMMSHLNGLTNRNYIKKIFDMEKKQQKIENLNIKYREKIKKLKSELNIKNSNKNNDSSSAEVYKNIINFYKERNRELVNGIDYQILTNELTRIKLKLEKEEIKSAYYYKKYVEIQEKLQKATTSLTEIEKKMQIKNYQINAKSNNLKNKLNNNNEVELSSLKNKCQLEGKSILYVGGKQKSIPVCRKFIESLGASFIYHDGGIENSMKLLCGKLNKADCIFCPINCISHKASNKIKEICSKKNKKVVFLKTTGISSLIKELKKKVC